MLKIFTSMETLLWEVQADRHIEGDGASTANRFPVRFVLFDNFRDCCTFVDDCLHLPNIAIQRLEDWMDNEYPDQFRSHKFIADKILKLIQDNPTEYRIIMPFSELARFYNNEPGRKEFDALIATVKGYDTNKIGYTYKQRIYIPIVGLEGKMQYFRDDSQSFIWYFHNADHQLDYRLILTNNTTYGVHGLESKYNIAHNLTEWLGFWKYPNLKHNIISFSKSIFSHSGYAKPDNAFTFCTCKNAYEFLTKGLKLDVDCIPYVEEDNIYWENLASKIDISNFKFDDFINEQFGIYNLADYNVFFETWFKNKQPFMRWLLAKYYVYKFCDKGYTCRVLQRIDGYSDVAFAKALAITIFTLENPEQYIEERNIGLEYSTQNGIELAPEVQTYLIEKLESIEREFGIQSAIKYVSCLSYAEKEHIIKWYRDGRIQKEELKKLYPDLYYYLGKTIASSEDPWVLDYFDKYKEAKVRNQYTNDIKNYILTKNKNEIEHYKWSSKFSTTRTIMCLRQDIQAYIWIDGLGVDWVPFISQIVKEHELDGYYLNEVFVATAKLPTRTEINKADIDILTGGLNNKEGDIDKVAHTCRPYPKFVIDDLIEIRKLIHKILLEHPGEKIAIISDHGLSYMSQLKCGYNLKGYKSDHFGRVALVPSTNKNLIVSDDKYKIITLPDGNNKAICALKHESLMAKIPDGMGCHGGCTPEEQLVPIIIISPTKSTATWRAVFKSFEVEEANPVVVYSIVGLDNNQQPMVEYDGKFYSMTITGNIYTSERLPLKKEENKVILHIGTWQKEPDIFTIKMAVIEDDPFAFN